MGVNGKKGWANAGCSGTFLAHSSLVVGWQRGTMGMTVVGRVKERAVLHPYFLLALTLLLLNDHWLKGAGVLPGWLTGKLSDFAGLVVAPVFLASLVPRAWRRIRWLGFALPVVVFCAINLSARAALAWDSWLGLTGMSVRTVCDPSDLMALAVLPVAVFLAGKHGTHRAAPRKVRVWERLFLVLAGYACLATTALAGDPAGYAFVRNGTQRTITVRVGSPGIVATSQQSGPDCEFLETLGDVSEDMFETWTTFDLAPLGSAGLGWCAAVVVVDPLPPVAVAFPDAGLVPIDELGKHRQQVVWVQGVGSPVDYSVGSALERLELAPPQQCEPIDESSLSWTNLDASGTAYTLAALRATDTCIELDFEWFEVELCMPLDLFPFAEGDALRLDGTSSSRGRRLTLEDEATGTRLTLAREAPPSGLRFDAVACDEQTTGCGSIEQPGRLLRDDDSEVLPGETIVWSTGASSDARLFLARARQVLNGSDSCAAPRSQLGSYAEFVLLEAGQ